MATPNQSPQPGSADDDLQRMKMARVTHPDIGEDDPMLAGLPLESGCTCRASSPTCTAIWMNGA